MSGRLPADMVELLAYVSNLQNVTMYAAGTVSQGMPSLVKQEIFDGMAEVCA